MNRDPLHLAIFFTLFSQAAFGQYYDPYGGGYGYGGYHASTAGEGYARGMADIIRSQGMKNLLDAQASTEFETARTKYLNNRTLAAQKFWERREIYQQKQAEQNYQLAERRQRRLERNRLEPLAPAEFDETTGDIRWPSILTNPEFDQYRMALEDIFHKWAKYGSISSDDYLTATEVAREWRHVVAGPRADYSVDQRRLGVRFILRLSEELDGDVT
jgi:hypothetical protein